ncbi:MAG: DUF433 domain-containing protein [Candidatus Thiothrix moscowensis]|nr:DUF433 domain-containing protein [Candidatus Thiothrix moscowensis]
MGISDMVGKGLYSAREAAHIIRVPATTLHRWVFGYRSKNVVHAGLWQPEIREPGIISFHDLLELKLVHEFRQHGLSLPVIREAARIAREEFGTSYPFARQYFYTDGKKVFLEAAQQMGDAHLVDVISKQYVMENVYRPSFLASIDYSSIGDAERWYPVNDAQHGGQDKSVVLDPQRAFGKPILTQSGIPTRVLYDAYRLDEPLDVIAANYAITPEEVKQAVLYESRLQDAA